MDANLATTESLRYWMSNSSPRRPDDLPDHILMVSIVLDAAIREDFSGIRVLLVRDDPDGKQMSAMESFDHGRYAALSHRNVLSSLRASKRYRTAVFNHDARSLCTVVFEVTSGQFDNRGDPITHSRIQPLLQKPTHPKEVIYDSAFPLDASLLLSFECKLKVSNYKGDYWSGLTWDNAYSAHILPTQAREPLPPSNFLTESIINCVASYSLSPREYGWRRDLRTYGMVKKSWSYLLDLVFPILAKFHDGELLDPVPITSFARSLAANPTRAALLNIYTPSQFDDMRDSDSIGGNLRLSDYEAQNSILSLVSSYKKLCVAGTHPSLSQAFFNILCGLRRVRTFHVHPKSWNRENTGMYQLSVNGIQRIISRWRRVRRLEIKDTDALNPDEAAEETEPELAYQMIDLALFNVSLSVRQLLIFASPRFPTPILRRVKLVEVSSLTNADLLSFLTHVGPGLFILSIYDCSFSRASPEEEYAVDATMPSMTSLERAILFGDIASSLSITRKPIRTGPPTGNKWEKQRISLNNPDVVTQESVNDALQTTHWEHVWVYGTWNRHSYQLHLTAKNIAKSRGIIFEYEMPQPSPPSSSYCSFSD